MNMELQQQLSLLMKIDVKYSVTNITTTSSGETTRMMQQSDIPIDDLLAFSGMLNVVPLSPLPPLL
jgi:hypothetical protein